MSSKRDIWEVWDDTGQLESVKAFIKDCSRKLITQAEMCKYLNIDTATFSRLKKKHPEIAEIQENAKLDLKKDLMDALYKKAIGYEIVEEDQYIEDRGAGGVGYGRNAGHNAHWLGHLHVALVLVLGHHTHRFLVFDGVPDILGGEDIFHNFILIHTAPGFLVSQSRQLPVAVEPCQSHGIHDFVHLLLVKPNELLQGFFSIIDQLVNLALYR